MQPRRVTHNIGDSKFIYGRPNERNALGVREGAVSNQIQYIPENLPLKSPHWAPLLSNSIFCKSLNIYTPEKPQHKKKTNFITHSEISQWPATSNKFSIQLHFLHLLRFENSLYNQSAVTVWNFRNRRWKTMLLQGQIAARLHMSDWMHTTISIVLLSVECSITVQGLG